MAVGSSLGAPSQDACERVPPDDLAAAEAAAIQSHLDVMAPAGELGGNCLGEAVLHQHCLVLKPLPAGGIQGGLRIEAKVNGVHDHLQVALGLHKPAHDSERPYRLPLPGDKAGDNCVVGALARGQHIFMTGVKGEVMTAVLQGNAGARHHKAGTEAHIIALDV